jgi:hypothetical protein
LISAYSHSVRRLSIATNTARGFLFACPAASSVQFMFHVNGLVTLLSTALIGTVFTPALDRDKFGACRFLFLNPERCHARGVVSASCAGSSPALPVPALRATTQPAATAQVRRKQRVVRYGFAMVSLWSRYGFAMDCWVSAASQPRQSERAPRTRHTIALPAIETLPHPKRLQRFLRANPRVSLFTHGRSGRYAR